MPRGGRRFSEDEKTRHMLVLALNGGHIERAHNQLADEGHTVSTSQLDIYRNSERYQQIRDEYAPKIEADLIQHIRENARRSLELQALATEQAIVEAEAGELKDAAKTAQNAAIASGINIDKALVLDGRPTVITSHTNSVQDLVNEAFQALGMNPPALEAPIQVPNEATQEAT